MDKTVGNPCPDCGVEALDVYYDENSDLRVGARCQECGFLGFFMNGELLEVPEI